MIKTDFLGFLAYQRAWKCFTSNLKSDSLNVSDPLYLKNIVGNR